MLELIKKTIADTLTEPNNKTVCIVRLAGIGGFLYGLGAHAYQVFWLHAPFDFLSFGGGLSAMLAALGLALGMKKDTSP
jgi:hypothetical protein